VAEHLHDAIGCRALFATHYHELTELARTLPHAVNVSVSAREHDGGIVFLHSVQQGPASRSYGVAVAKLAGLPESVLARARARLAGLEAEGTRTSSAARPASRREGLDQLGLFGSQGLDPSSRRVLDTLRAVELDRVTPLEALTLLAKLKSELEPSG
jgi:DNA mismatch repair protein MutS